MNDKHSFQLNTIDDKVIQDLLDREIARYYQEMFPLISKQDEVNILDSFQQEKEAIKQQFDR